MGRREAGAMVGKKCTHEGTLWQPHKSTAPTSLQGGSDLPQPSHWASSCPLALSPGCSQAMSTPGHSGMTLDSFFATEFSICLAVTPPIQSSFLPFLLSQVSHQSSALMCPHLLLFPVLSTIHRQVPPKILCKSHSILAFAS